MVRGYLLRQMMAGVSRKLSAVTGCSFVNGKDFQMLRSPSPDCSRPLLSAEHVHQ